MMMSTTQDKQSLARIVKDAQRTFTADPSRVECDFKAYIKKHLRGALASKGDPMRHAVETLRAFVATLGDGWTGTPREPRGKESDAYRTKRDAWDAWSAEEEAGTSEDAVWGLVRRTRAHESFKEAYYGLPSHREGWRRTKYRPVRWCIERGVVPVVLGVDCEMCETDVDSRALVGVSVVDARGETLLKTLVKPPGKIIDLKQEITGLNEADVMASTMTLSHVQDAVVKLCKPGTVLVGHSLMHDLRALKIDHQPVIDSALLFRYANLPRSTPGLAMLCQVLLNRKMRQSSGGFHDSSEDAKAALDLVLWEARQLKPTYEIPAPAVKVDAQEMCKLFVHRIPRGTHLEVLKSIFAEEDRDVIVDIDGKFLGDDVAASRDARENAKPTSCHVIFPSTKAANDAFERIDGVSGTDAIARPQKAYKMQNEAGLVATVCVRKMSATASGQIFGVKDAGEDGKRKSAHADEQEPKKKRQRKPRIALPGDAK